MATPRTAPSSSVSDSAGHAYATIGCTTRIMTDLSRAGWIDLIGGAEYVLENAATFDRIKQAIKKQQVCWLHVYLDADDATKKATQLARAHDRSRGLWLIEAYGDWTAKSPQLRALSELDGVQSARTDTRYHLANHAAALPPYDWAPDGRRVLVGQSQYGLFGIIVNAAISSTSSTTSTRMAYNQGCRAGDGRGVTTETAAGPIRREGRRRPAQPCSEHRRGHQGSRHGRHGA